MICNPRLTAPYHISRPMGGGSRLKSPFRQRPPLAEGFNHCEGGCKQTGSSVHEAIGISVVAPSYNMVASSTRPSGVCSIRNIYLEIMVADGSMDDTVGRLRPYADRISWTSQRDQGQCDAIIKGFARASKDRTIERAAEREL